MSARFIVGDVFDVLATLEPDSVDLVFSSPPFLALRSYLPADHPDKAKEIGSEATPADFLDTLLDVAEACDRVLAPHGSLCFELGDTFSGSGGVGGDYNEKGLRDGQPKFSGSALSYRKETQRNRDLNGWPLDKSLCLIPTLFAASLAYGYNMLRPERTTPRWRVRNLVVWARPNPPVGALGDKFRPATSYVTVACKSGKRYFDLDAVRTPYTELTLKNHGGKGSLKDGNDNGPSVGESPSNRFERGILTNPGAPPLDYWVIPTQPYKNSHYATFPEALCVKPIASMAPIRVCRVCGEPSRRITSERPQATAQETIAALIEDRRTALGITRGDMVPWFLDRYKNPDSVKAQISNWERAKNVPTPEDWAVLRSRLGLPADFDSLIRGERAWTESTVDYIDARGREVVGGERRSGGEAFGRGGVPQASGAVHAARVPPGGFSDCGHDDYRPGCVLDPFAGSGTTLAVATGHGRDAIGVDIDARNADLALERVGPMFLTVEP